MRTNIYQSLFFILRFWLIFMAFFMPKGFDYFKLLGKRLHQGVVFVRFFGDGWQDVLIIGIGEHSAQYAFADKALVIVECTGRAEHVANIVLGWHDIRHLLITIC